MHWITLLTISVLLGGSQAFEDDELEEEQEPGFVHPSNAHIQEAKTEYDRIVTYSKLPLYGSCWSVALADLHTNCRALTEDAQARLAIKFANCFIQIHSQATVPCGAREEIGVCIDRCKGASSDFFQSYLAFYTHTQNICFYLASEEWQRRAETQVNRLMDASHSVTLQLEETKVAQSEILEKQKTALVSSEALILHHERMNESITASQMALTSNLRELHRSASETRMWIGDIADRISRLQSIFIDEFTGFYSIIFYVMSGTMCFVLTSTSRTAGARLWLFFLLIGTFFVERYANQQQLAAFENEQGGMPDSALVTQYLNDEAWIIRKCFWALATAMLVYFGYRYQDINEANRLLIVELHREYQSIKSMIDNINTMVIKTRVPIGSTRVDGRQTRDRSFEPNSSSSTSMLNNLAERFRRSVTPSREEPDSTPQRAALPTVPEADEDRSLSEDNHETPSHRHRRSREVTPLSPDRLTPGRTLRSSSVTHVSERRSPSVSKSTSGTRVMGRRGIGSRREPTPEQTRSGLQHLSDITNRATQIIRDVMDRNGEGDEQDEE